MPDCSGAGGHLNSDDPITIGPTSGHRIVGIDWLPARVRAHIVINRSVWAVRTSARCKAELETHPLPHPHSPKLRSALVVDDEPLIRMALADFLAEEGFEVFEAEDADKAIAILEANPLVDIVVTDVQMPGTLDGLELAHVVRDRWPPTVLIVVSGAAQIEKVDLPTKSTFLRKPVDPRRVLGEIDRLAATA